MSSRERRRNLLPIKLVLPKQYTERKVPGGGAAPTPFRTVDRAYRTHLYNQVTAVGESLGSQMSQVGSIPLRARLHPKAMAKSHRPERLFNVETCPIIGAGKLGELYLKGTERGLKRLGTLIRRGDSDRVIKELSGIEAIEPITPDFRRGNVSVKRLLQASPRGERGFLTRVRLFDYGQDKDRLSLVEDFEKSCRKQRLRFGKGGYSEPGLSYEVECRTVNDVDALSRVVGIRSISGMPLMRTIRLRSLNPSPLPKNVPHAADFTGDFPVVVVVDTGISSVVPALGSWVIGRESYVPPEYQNDRHGTFVAGLISLGSLLNPQIAGIGRDPVAVFDMQVIPNDDPSHGEVDSLTESEFLQSLDTALRIYANRYKVWNLSLGTNEVCSLNEFSALAVELDDLQERYRVTFVISAGNYTSVPLLDYPRTDPQLETGRITSPADSVLGVTVGSVSHIDYKRKGPKEHHPSAFSRHGAGPNHIIKPDLVHYGGSCSIDGAHQSGVRSISRAATAEDLGTSFAAPLVSRTLAQIYHQVTPTPSPVLARALLTHHARDPRTQERVPDLEENYFGFGLPAPVPYCLECSPHLSTLVFEDVLRPGYFLEWDDFPYPTSLRKNGRYFGRIWMTVAFAPARSARWGTEYCETHIEAHLGVYYNQTSRTTGNVSSKFRGLVPPEHRNPGILYESYQVEKLRKWAPVRTYYGDLGSKGERGERWRLMVKLLTRHGIDGEDTSKPQPFALILTIADPEQTVNVYDEMAQIVRNRFQAENLTLRATARVRARS